MSTPYIGEIRMFGGNFPPVGWLFCDGQALPISQFDTLFALIGTTYGGDGVNTFNVPDLRGRIPIHTGPGFVQGQALGTETVTLNVPQLPAHSHSVLANSSPGTSNVSGAEYAADLNNPIYNSPDGTLMANTMVQSTGGSQPHDNMMPFQCVNFIIATEGIFPTQS